ncbi:MAG: hypothetical protein AAF307_07715 [Pseudomonadota bacterium]
MDPDLSLAVGVVTAAFSVPSILSALSDRRAPRASAVTVLIGGCLILYATQTNPGGYEVTDVPDVLVRVMERYLL